MYLNIIKVRLGQHVSKHNKGQAGSACILNIITVRLGQHVSKQNNGQAGSACI